MRPPSEHRDWISGLIRCSACGRSIIRASANGGYWKCEGYTKGRCAASQHVSDEKIKAAIIERMQHDATSPRPFDYTIVRPRSESERSGADVELQINRLLARLSRLRDAYLDGAESLEDYKAAKAKLEKDLGKLRSAVLVKADQGPTKETDAAMRQNLRQAVEVLLSPTATVQEKHAAAHQCIDH